MVHCISVWCIINILRYYILGPYCPVGYQHLGRAADGRTCHGDNILDDGNGTNPSSFTDGSCFSGYDRVRERWTPKTALEVSRYRNFFA